MAEKKEKKYVIDNARLMAEWDWERNVDIFPSQVTLGSHKKAWWKCSEGHVWPAIIYNRSKGKGCKECAKLVISQKLRESKLVVGENDLASQRPDLLAEWDYENNSFDVTPETITVGYGSKKVNWICKTCNHRWPATVYSRVHLDSGCPECGNRIISEKNRERLFNSDKSLIALFPDIASEWHPTKNVLSVDSIMPGCNDEAWWICSTCGEEYPARVVNRTGYKHVGCPACNRYMHTSFPEQAIYFYVKKAYVNAQNKYKDCFNNQMELDVFIPELQVGIEYDGAYWHSESSIKRNIKKYEVCKQQNIFLIRIKENYKRYSVFEEDCDYSIYRENEYDDGLIDTIKKLLGVLGADVLIDLFQDRSEIRSQYIISFKEKSLLAKYPELSLEWHPTKNGKLKPDMVMPGSGDKVWWLCPKCGYDYPAAPNKRTREKPTGCPVCANRVIIPGINDLATLRPDLACEWHPSKNGNLRPTEIAPNYSKKVWWKCAMCGHEYPKTPNKRVSAVQGCTECSKKSVAQNLHDRALRAGVNDLASQYPDLLKEWDYEANVGLPSPQNITVGNTSIHINWCCSTCGNKWLATAYSRTHLKTGCEKCGWKKTGAARRASALKKGVNDLASQCPEMLKDWDYEKNSGLVAPDEITIGNSKTKVFWKCNICGNEWKTYVYLRVHRKQGCRLCSRRNRKVNPHPSK